MWKVLVETQKRVGQLTGNAAVAEWTDDGLADWTQCSMGGGQKLKYASDSLSF
eukprot:SAG11_NODE_27128_length_336_cov_1.092827_1_plen_52_part_10